MRASLESCSSVEAYLSASEGAHLRGRTYLAYRVDARLDGLVVWGEPTAQDLSELVALFARERARGPKRCASLVDFRRLKVLDPQVFAAWAAYAREHRAVQAERMEREAVVRPVEGLVATVLAGYRAIVEPAHPLEVFTSTADALAWLERSDALGAVSSIEALADVSPLLVRLVEVLSGDLSLGADAAAKRVGLSTRALQRSLKDAGTTFRAEVQRARLALAKRLLADGAAIADVAARVGLGSPQSFTKLFTRVAGVSPGSWRELSQRQD